jgi:hypothetical protein
MAGVLLSDISRRSLWINGALFCIVVLYANTSASASQAYPFTFDCNAAVHANTFYRSVFPVLFLSICILLPAILGMRQGLRLNRLSASLRSLLLVFVLICSLSLLAGVSTSWWLRIWSLSPLALAAFAVVGPAGYLVIQPRRQIA